PDHAGRVGRAAEARADHGEPAAVPVPPGEDVPVVLRQAGQRAPEPGRLLVADGVTARRGVLGRHTTPVDGARIVRGQWHFPADVALGRFAVVAAEILCVMHYDLQQPGLVLLGPPAGGAS